MKQFRPGEAAQVGYGGRGGLQAHVQAPGVLGSECRRGERALEETEARQGGLARAGHVELATTGR